MDALATFVILRVRAHLFISHTLMLAWSAEVQRAIWRKESGCNDLFKFYKIIIVITGYFE